MLYSNLNATTFLCSKSRTIVHGHQTIAIAPSCSSFSSPWDWWCLKRCSAAKSQWCVKLNHGQRKYDRLQWILRRYNHLQTPRTIYSLEPPFHPLSNAPMLAYVRYSLTIKLVGNKLIRKPKKNASFLPPWKFSSTLRRGVISKCDVATASGPRQLTLWSGTIKITPNRP